MATEIHIRPAVQSDHRYLADTIRSTLLINSAYCKGLHPATMEALIDPVLATYQTLVANPPEDPDAILGFVVFRDPETVAFVYVRSQFRSRPAGAYRTGGGIARALLARAGIARASRDGRGPVPEISCAFMVTNLEGQHGQAFAKIAESKGYRLRFRPYAPLEVVSRVHFGKEIDR